MINYPIKFNPLSQISDFKQSSERRLLKTLLEKEKMLVSSIFSFFHNVFCPSRNTFWYFFFITFILLSTNAFNLDQSKILPFGKEFTITKTNFNSTKWQNFTLVHIQSICRRQNICDSKIKIYIGKNRKHWGKRRKCWLPAFSCDVFKSFIFQMC